MTAASAVPALELIGVKAGYGKIEILHDVNLVVPAGSVVALLGPNGAGKSTTLGVASGRVVPTAGCLHVGGRHVNGLPPEALVRGGVCSIPEGRGVFANLTVRDNLKLWSHGTDKSMVQIESLVYARFPRLKERRRQLAGSMSGGEQQMLAVARAVVADAGLLLLDEISMGLAPRIVAELYELVAQLAADGLAILLVEQFAQTALAVADHAAIMTSGSIKASGSPADIAAELADAYLGGAA
ncbi:MAG: branched-chain amino acid transport system ATP-binding protein [Actinomycetota bacterium]|nr:branched-chain amino acid transport system ATP-binding protein [Actinomycetota bacterium]